MNQKQIKLANKVENEKPQTMGETMQRELDFQRKLQKESEQIIENCRQTIAERLRIVNQTEGAIAVLSAILNKHTPAEAKNNASKNAEIVGKEQGQG